MEAWGREPRDRFRIPEVAKTRVGRGGRRVCVSEGDRRVDPGQWVKAAGARGVGGWITKG